VLSLRATAEFAEEAEISPCVWFPQGFETLYAFVLGKQLMLRAAGPC
jgi:hypothetical protein